MWFSIDLDNQTIFLQIVSNGKCIIIEEVLIMKKLFFTLIINMITVILLTGCFWNTNNQDYDDETINKAIQSAESYIKNNFKDIEKIDFSDDHRSPMGGFTVRGYVNDNKDANFDMTVEIENNYNIPSMGMGKDFPERKEECKEKTCDY